MIERVGYLRTIHPNLIAKPICDQQRVNFVSPICSFPGGVQTRPVVTLSSAYDVKPPRVLPRSGSDALSLRTESKSLCHEEKHFISPTPVQDLKGAAEKLRKCGKVRCRLTVQQLTVANNKHGRHSLPASRLCLSWSIHHVT